VKASQTIKTPPQGSGSRQSVVRLAGAPRSPAGRARRRLRATAIPKLRLALPPTLATLLTPAPSPDAPLQPGRVETSEALPLPVALAIPVAALTTPVAEVSNALIMRGEYWEARYGGRTLMLDDCRGLRYIALLIRDAGPGKGPLHAKELVVLASGHEPGTTELERADDLLDAVAQRQLIERLEEIGSERDRACAAEDFRRAAELDAEQERIAEELSHAAPPSTGRRRRAAFSHAGEKARKAVGKAISEAIVRIASYPDRSALAEHLVSTIHKGQWLSYSGSADWHIDFHSPLPRK
jgi:hypothetical protein